MSTEDEYKLYKIWPGGKQGIDPFFITDSFAELLEKYEFCSKEWGIKPQYPLLKQLEKEYQQKQNNDEPTNFFTGNFHDR